LISFLDEFHNIGTAPFLESMSAFAGEIQSAFLRTSLL
jgi:hypothetical protein